VRIVLYRKQIRHVASGSEAGPVPCRLAVRELWIVGQLAQISIGVAREHSGSLAIPAESCSVDAGLGAAPRLAIVDRPPVRRDRDED
jgi:hypothetical protein